jgi:hypothetical protein
MKKGTSTVFRDDVEREEARLRAERYIRRLETDFKRQLNEDEPLYYDRLVKQVKLSGDKYKPKHTRVDEIAEKEKASRALNKVVAQLKSENPELAPVPASRTITTPLPPSRFPKIKSEPTSVVF